MALKIFLQLPRGTESAPPSSPPIVPQISATIVCSRSRATGLTNPSFKSNYDSLVQPRVTSSLNSAASSSSPTMPSSRQAWSNSLSNLSWTTLSDCAPICKPATFGFTFKFASYSSFNAYFLWVSARTVLTFLFRALEALLILGRPVTSTARSRSRSAALFSLRPTLWVLAVMSTGPWASAVRSMYLLWTIALDTGSILGRKVAPSVFSCSALACAALILSTFLYSRYIYLYMKSAVPCLVYLAPGCPAPARAAAAAASRSCLSLTPRSLRAFRSPAALNNRSEAPCLALPGLLKLAVKPPLARYLCYSFHFLYSLVPLALSVNSPLI